MKIINSSQAPRAIGPYSHAVVCGNLIFCAGQIGLNPKNGRLEKGIVKQTERSLKNLESILKTAGADLDKVIKTTIYLKKINDFTTVNQIYTNFFKNHKPARSTVEVANLPKNALIEIEAIAYAKKG